MRLWLSHTPNGWYLTRVKPSADCWGGGLFVDTYLPHMHWKTKPKDAPALKMNTFMELAAFEYFPGMRVE